ncbi:conjugal transfer protein TraB [Rhizobium sp. AQ_MP]|uniref:conjugal transfer protein TraB n=1 Tax=Rhizobium sp. AQ_MP TaxID=2761536 RepID=UPI00163B030F|nr:conjugal transfer protein TraB [Rhizobium sp. AQ_MP]MBC2775808.1 conjugal transfer protein TraB [Rhizobium sp. AQ_MP]
MRRDWLETLLLVFLSAAIGALGWSGHVALLPAALFFPLLWAKAEDRWTALLVSSAYFLSASRGLPIGASTYFAADFWMGLALWLVSALAFVLIHTLLWTARHGWQRPLRYSVVLVLTGLPPFGITGWAHPLTAAGVLFPGFGWTGLSMTVLILSYLIARPGLRSALLLAGLWLWSAVFWTDPALPKGWQGVDLSMGASLGRDPSLRRHTDLSALVLESYGAGASVIVLPETALGFWTPVIERFWQNVLKDRAVSVMAGAAVVTEEGYDNVLLLLDSQGGRIFYRQRMPVPIAMWRPWERFSVDPGGTLARFFAKPVVKISGTRIAPLICYEQLLLWPVLHSMFYDPEVIVLTGNGWWTTGTNIIAVQQASAAAWASLFGKGLVTAFNR